MNATRKPSAHLFYPKAGALAPYRPGAVPRKRVAAADAAGRAIVRLAGRKDYPCVAALRAVTAGEYRVGVYSAFGSGESSRALGRDLSLFKAQQAESKSPYLTFWAVFDDASELTEEEFESVMWKELSALSASTPEAGRWDPKFSANPADKDFCFSFEGDAFFLVGMHPRSSRLARRFPFPAVVFNLYEQFEALGDGYDPLVRRIRRRDALFSGSVNPVVERWADRWESIQFSGRDNPPDWKCPFRKGGA